MKTLYHKISLIFLIILCIIGLSFVVITWRTSYYYQEEISQKLNHELAAHIVSEKVLLEDGVVNHDALKHIFHMLMVFNPSIEIYLLNPKGEILAFSAKPDVVKRKSVDLIPIKESIDQKVQYPYYGDDPREIGRKKVFSAAPVVVDDKLHGYLYVILEGQHYDKIASSLFHSYILRVSLWYVLAAIAIALVIGLALFYTITRRLKKLHLGIQTYDHNKLKPEMVESFFKIKPSSSPDEIDDLNIAFNKLVRKVHSQVQEIKQVNHLRKELVANISHDIRTPISALQGYADTIKLKGENIHKDALKKYIDIMCKQCSKLSLIIDELFELAKLDSNAISIKKQNFLLSELVQDTVQKFQLMAEKRNINLTVNISKHDDMIQADISLIERVFDNLISNALKHTNKGGKINITLTPKKNIVLVYVKDSGQGISKETLPFIFDRYYKKSNPENELVSSGLGLAITKKILNLHDSNIQVRSKIGKGTTFYFPLALNI